MLLFAVFSSLFVLISTQITCHSDCAPYKCHGPTARNCNECGKNMALVGDRCKCTPGWFDDSSGRCKLYVPYCLSVYWDGTSSTWKCTQCETTRDVLNADGTCTRDMVTPFFIRKEAGAYTGSTTNKNDVDYFFNKRCKTLDTLGKCAECYPNAVLNTTTGACDIFNPKCAVLDPLNPNKCLTGVGGFYPNKTTGQLANCFYSCKTCTAPGAYDCLSCLNNFYFEKQPNGDTGTCKACSTSCVSCYGPTNLDCTKVLRGQYVEREDQSTLNQVKPCATNCDYCESGTNCTHCGGLKTSLNGACTAITNSLGGCKHQYNTTSSNAKCLKWNNNYLTDASLSKFVTNTPYYLNWNNCLKINQAPIDRISFDCQVCYSASSTIYDSGFCRTVSTTPVLNCEVLEIYSTTNTFCLRCQKDFILGLDNLCHSNVTYACDGVSVDGSAYTTLNFWKPVNSEGETNLYQVCSRCSTGCISCFQEGYGTICSACDEANGFILYKGFCSSSRCNSNAPGDPEPILSFNKQCDLAISGTLPSECSTDCMLFDLNLCQAENSCQRKIFELISKAENTAVLSIRAEYMDYLDFDLLSDAIVDTSDTSNTKQVFCKMIFPTITDQLTKCFFHNTSADSEETKNITILATTQTMNYLSTLVTIPINTNLIIPKRRFLDVASYQIYSIVDVSVATNHIKNTVVITSSSYANLIDDYGLEFEILESIRNVTYFKWALTSCLVGGIPDQTRMDDINNELSAANSSKISSSQLVDQLFITVQVIVNFSATSSEITTGTIYFANSNNYMKLLGNKSRIFKPSQQMNLIFEFLGLMFDPTKVYVKENGFNLQLDSDFYLSRFYEASRKVIVRYIPQTNNKLTLTVGYNEVGVTDLPETIFLLNSPGVDLINLKFPRELGKNQNLKFWCSVGSDYQYQIFAFRSQNSLQIFSTSLETSNFDNTVNHNLLNADPQRVPDNNEEVLLLVRFVSSEFDVMYSTSLIARGYDVNLETNTLVGTTYRDGSNLQISTKDLSVGVHLQNNISGVVLSDGYTATTTLDQNILSLMGNTETQTLSQSNVVNAGNKLVIQPSNAPANQISTEFAYYYKDPKGYLHNGKCYLKMFNPPKVSLEIKNLISNASQILLFEINVVSSAVYNKFLTYDISQYKFIDRLHYGKPDITSVYFPSVDPYHWISIEKTLLSFTTSSKPWIDVLIYDFNSIFSSVNSVVLEPDPSVTLTQLPVSTYITSVTDKLTAASNGDELLRELNMVSFVCNHAYLACKYDNNCLDQDLPVRNLRGTLWQHFSNFWSTVSDKDGWQDWTSSVLKNSFINAVTLGAGGMDDSTIDSIDQELTREVNSLISRVSASTAGLSRIAYKIPENMKPILQVTYHNLELLLSAFSHSLRLFGYFYSGLSTPEAYQTKLNQVYVQTIAINEMKLLRYTMTSDTTVFENELLVIGGATILAPIEGKNYFFSFTDSLAVELKNLAFNVSKVSLHNFRNHTRCL